MNNLDIEIYMSQFVTFFENNPNDLLELIGDSNRESFYNLVKEQCEKNLGSGDEVSLTQHQIIEIVVKLKKVNLETHKMVVIVDKVFQSTSLGIIGLN
jgi:hypothetical protein